MGLHSPGDHVESVLRGFLAGAGWSADEVLIVAFSGGPDSTTLLAALAALGSWQLRAVHVDHGLRPEAERLEELHIVRSCCTALGVRLTVAKVGASAIATYARKRGCGIEAAARAFRYRALRSVMEREASSRVLLAHTKDDAAETALMRLLGGAGSAGLRGIAAVNPPWFRPFLGLTKRELLDYLGERKLPWSSDSTNASTGYLRNRVRLLLMPLLDRDFPGWRSGIGLTMERAAMDSEALREAARRIGFKTDGEGRMSTEAATFLAAPEAVQLAALLPAAGLLTNRDRLSLRMARRALAIVKTGNDGRYQGGGLRMQNADGRVVLERGLDFPRRGGYFVVIDRPCRVRAGRLLVEVSWTAGGDAGIRACAFRFPLVVRSRRPGDSIALPGGSKRLDDLFSEWGVTARRRDMVPVVEDREGIVAVLGSPFGAVDRYRRGPEDEDGESTRLTVTVKGA